MKKPLLLKILLPSMAIIMAAIVVIIFAHSTTSNVNFTYFEPAYLPPNVSIKEKRIVTRKGEVESIDQNFRTEDWVYSIYEFGPGYKSNNATIGTANQDYDPTSIKPTCNLATSANKQYYRVCHWIDYGRISVYEVKFVKSGTYIRTMMPSTLQQQISLKQIDKYVDSFKSADTKQLPLLKLTGFGYSLAAQDK